MIIDTSALIAILYREPEAVAFAQVIHDTDICRMSVANYVELAIVVERQLGPDGMRQAFVDFGKGRNKASLNFGDCFADALVKDTGEPLLFKGNDFVRTDIPAAV